MENQALIEKISLIAPDIEFVEEGSQFLNIIVPSGELHQVAVKLKEDENLAFDFLFCLSGVDWMKHLSVIYHLRSTKHNHSIVLKTTISERGNPVVDSVCDIWRTAEFHEREVYDLFGITFKNHPDLRRILLDEDWKGYPLRKDYEDEVNIVEL